MKRFFSISSILSLLFLALTIPSLAADADTVEAFVNSDTTEYAKEFAEMSEEMGFFKDAFGMEQSSEYQTEAARSSYRLYTINTVCFDRDLSGADFLSDITTGTYVWTIPMNAQSVLLMEKQDGAWISAGSITASESGDPLCIDKEMLSDILVREFTNEELSQAEMIYGRLDIYNTYFALLDIDGERWMIPFGGRPDFTGLEIGKIYTPAEVDTLLRENLEEPSEPGLVGGFYWSEIDNPTQAEPEPTEPSASPVIDPTPASPEPEGPSSILWILLGAGGVVVIGAVVIAAVLIHRRKKNG